MADEPKPLTKEEMHKAIEAMKELAMTVYDMMDSGMSIVVSLPEPRAVVVPGRPPKMRTIIISKPEMVLTIMPKG